MNKMKNRYRKNRKNVKLKLKKDVYERNKRWKREEWNMNIVSLRDSMIWSEHDKVRLTERK